MTITGTITTALPETNGVSKAGKNWRRRDYILTYDNSKPEYPKSVLFSVMNDNIDRFSLQEGKEYQVEIDFTTREVGGRFFMDANCWRAKANNVDPSTGEVK